MDLEAQGHGVVAPAPLARGRRPDREELEVRSDLGDAGEMLDATATAYKARLEELQAQLNEERPRGSPPCGR